MKALITGISGQDGSYLAGYLASRGVSVVGLDRRLRLDITDPATVANVVRETEPDWVFNLAAQTYVGDSWDAPYLHMATNYGGVLNVLEAVKQYAPKAHVVQASTSEMFGKNGKRAMDEDHPFVPSSPYAVSKVAAHHLCRVYRESYGMKVSCAISFNHESPIRPEHFVTRKITKAAAEGRSVKLGNIDSVRDWGFAGDYVKAYVLMAERDEGDDFVIGTGETHTVREVAEIAYGPDWENYVRTSTSELRPNDVDWLCADPSKAKRVLGWEPETTFEELIRMMVEVDQKVGV